MKKLLALIVVSVTALFCAATASAETYTHYINCGTGAYIYTVNITWNGYSNVITTSTSQIWGRC
jgi:hypothetical protein